MPDSALWQPGANKAALQARATLLRKVREFFLQRDVLEVETPLLSSTFGTEPSIEPLASEYQGPAYAQGRKLYLQSSPEFFMKRLLANGSGAIYQIAKAFRNGESGNQHNPEFTLLEWYRPGFNAQELMCEVAVLMHDLLDEAALPVKHIQYAALFQQQLDLDIFTSSVDDLKNAAQNHPVAGIQDLQLDKDGWLDLLMSQIIEPALPKDTLCFVYDYPHNQASLAKINAADPRTAARFELYYQGMELANGFVELTDALEQSKRFEHENRIRCQRGQASMPIDQHFLAALTHGLPDMAGVSLGLDRVLMCQLGVDDIDQVLAFSLHRI